MHLSYLGPILFSCFPCFLHSPELLRNHRWGEVVVVAISAGSVLRAFWEPSFTFGRQKSLMAVISPVSQYGRRSFHFTETRTKTLDHALFTPSVSWLTLVLPMWPCEMWHALLLGIVSDNLFFQRQLSQTSLVVQWMRICLPMQGTQIRSLEFEKFHMPWGS